MHSSFGSHEIQQKYFLRETKKSGHHPLEGLSFLEKNALNAAIKYRIQVTVSLKEEDLKQAMEKIAPSNIPYEHNKRWSDGNGFSHVRAALMKPSLTIPVFDGKLTWKHGSRLSSLILTTGKGIGK